MGEIKIDDLTSAIVDALQNYCQDVTDGLKQDIKNVAEDCKNNIQQNSPMLTGSYRKGWKSKIAYEGNDDIRMVIFNRTDYQLTHLLEYGHSKINGGRVEGRPHIRPAEKQAEEKLLKRIKAVSNG